MPRKVQIRKGAAAVNRGRGPSVQRQVIPREVPNVANPMEAASFHASRMADRLEVVGRELGNRFGAIGNSLVNASKVVNQEEVDRLKEEAREQQMQAQLDFYEGKASQTDNEAYLFERERLEAAEKVADAKREQSFQRSVETSERLRTIARTQEAERAATRAQLNEEFLKTGNVVSGVGVKESHRDVLIDVNAGIVNDRVSEKLTELTSSQTGLTQRQLLQTIIETSNAALEGMDPDTKASIVSRVIKKQKAAVERYVAADRAAAIQRQQQNAELAHAANFMDGRYSDPNSGVKAYLADVQRTAVAYGGDLNKAIQGSIRQIVSRAESEMRKGNLDVYQKAVTFLNKATDNNPDLQSIAHKALTAARKSAYDSKVKELGNELQVAITEGDDTKVHQLFTSHQQHHTHPAYLTAFKAYRTFFEKREKATENEMHAKRWREGSGEFDPKKARKYVDQQQTKMLQSDRLQDFVVDASELNHVGAEAKRHLNSALTDVSALDAWDATEEGPGRAVGVINAYNALSLLPENLRDEALDNGIGGATFTAINDLVAGGQSVQNAAFSVLTTLRTKGEDLKSIDKTIRFQDFYPGTNGEPSTKTAGEAQSAFAEEIVSVASELVGTSVDVHDMSGLIEDAGRLLKTQAIINGGRITEDMRRQAIRQAAHNYVAVPNPDAGIADNERTLVKPHQNPSVAREVRDAWKRAGGNAAEQFENGVSLVKTTLPFIVQRDTSIQPSLHQAPDEHAARGWMAVTGDDRSYGSIIMVGPGEELTGMGERPASGNVVARETGVAPTETFQVKKALSSDTDTFEAEIEGMNRLMAGTPFQWLKQPGTGGSRPLYYLAFRPRPVGFPEQSTVFDLHSIAETAEDAITAAEESLKNLTPQIPTKFGTVPGSDPDNLPEARAEVIRDAVSHLTKSPESTVPRSLGLTVNVPDRFESTDEAIEWLRTATNTHTINNKAARAPSLRDPNLPDHDNAINYLAGWNGNSNQATLDAVYRERSEIGVGVPLEAEWVQEWLKEKAGLARPDIKDVIDGRKGLPDGIVKLLNIEAVNRAHQTLASKVDQEVLADLPFDARMVLTGIVLDGEKALTDDIVEAVNAREWVAASVAIRAATSGTSKRRLRQNLERKRISEAAQFEIALGVGG